jgi:hypothetical protein
MDVDAHDLFVARKRGRQRGIVFEPQVAPEPDDRLAHAPAAARAQVAAAPIPKEEWLMFEFRVI